MKFSPRTIEIGIAIVIAAIVVAVTAGPAASTLVALAALVVCGLTILWDRRAVRRRARRGYRRPPSARRRSRRGNRRQPSPRRRTMER